MLIEHYANVAEEKPHLAGAQATIRWLIAGKEGAPNFAMRVIELKSRGETIPVHGHPYEHEIFIIEGTGNVLTPAGASPVRYGNFIYVQPNEEHGFENTGDEPFRFICVIPTPR
jgi:quercetin dioxygenase-like cupin family protein